MSASSVKKQEPVSKLYAKALYEFATERNELSTVQEHFRALVDVFRSNPELIEALSADVFSTEERERLTIELTKKMALSPMVQRFAQLIAGKGRMRLVEQVYGAFCELVDESQGIVRGTVTTVEALTDAETADLAKTFARKFNKQVILEPAVDSDILGGLIVKIQGMTFDGSLKTTIRRLKENLERQSI